MLGARPRRPAATSPARCSNAAERPAHPRDRGRTRPSPARGAARPAWPPEQASTHGGPVVDRAGRAAATAHDRGTQPLRETGARVALGRSRFDATGAPSLCRPHQTRRYCFRLDAVVSAAALRRPQGTTPSRPDPCRTRACSPRRSERVRPNGGGPRGPRSTPREADPQVSGSGGQRPDQPSPARRAFPHLPRRGGCFSKARRWNPFACRDFDPVRDVWSQD
jgi:hypothetical protein